MYLMYVLCKAGEFSWYVPTDRFNVRLDSIWDYYLTLLLVRSSSSGVST